MVYTQIFSKNCGYREPIELSSEGGDFQRGSIFNHVTESLEEAAKSAYLLLFGRVIINCDIKPLLCRTADS